MRIQQTLCRSKVSAYYTRSERIVDGTALGGTGAAPFISARMRREPAVPIEPIQCGDLHVEPESCSRSAANGFGDGSGIVSIGKAHVRLRRARAALDRPIGYPLLATRSQGRSPTNVVEKGVGSLGGRNHFRAT